MNQGRPGLAAILVPLLFGTSAAALTGQQQHLPAADSVTHVRAASQEVRFGPEATPRWLSTRPAGGALRRSDLIWVGLLAGSLVAVEPAESAELAIARAVHAEGDEFGLGAFASVGEVAGHGFVAYGLAAGTFLLGSLTDEPLVARVGLRSLEALALTTATTASIKFALGRERPLYSPNASDEFRPFDLPLSRSSFPSGHTAHLFALAGTLSTELGDEAGWVPFIAYPVAGLVGMSRVVGRKHWVTDVVSGAAVGILSSRIVGRLHEDAPGPIRAIDPLIVPLPDGGLGLGLSVTIH